MCRLLAPPHRGPLLWLVVVRFARLRLLPCCPLPSLRCALALGALVRGVRGSPLPPASRPGGNAEKTSDELQNLVADAKESLLGGVGSFAPKLPMVSDVRGLPGVPSIRPGDPVNDSHFFDFDISDFRWQQVCRCRFPRQKRG